MSFTLIGIVLLILFNGGASILCPPEYNSIAMGCYKIMNGSTNTWSDARQYCNNDSKVWVNNDTVPNATTHLVALEREGERNALFYWMKAYAIQGQFWADGIVSTSLWSWSNRSIEWYFSTAQRAVSGNGSNYKLVSNGNFSDYQIADDINSNRLNFICEYQIIVVCNISNSSQSGQSSRCQNGGTCYSNPGDEICVCAPGYTGDNCETEVLECLAIPCLHGGVCIDAVNNYTCDCSGLFYTGVNCEIPTADPTQNQRSTAFWSVLGVVTGLVVLLTLSDLPWEDIMTSLGCSCNCFENCFQRNNPAANGNTLDKNQMAAFNGIPGLNRTNYEIMNTVYGPEQIHNQTPTKPQYNGYRSPDHSKPPDNRNVQSLGTTNIAKQSDDKRIYAVNINEPSKSKTKDPVDTMVSWTQELQEQLKSKKARETSASSAKQLIHSSKSDDY